MGSGVALALENALLVNEGRASVGSLAIGHDGRIAEVVYGGGVSCRADRVVDCCGDYLFPGLVDGHVHFREPGLTHKGDLASESRAAVAGGVTSFLDMPNTKPITDSVDGVRAKLALAGGRAWANYGFHLGATRGNVEEIRRSYGAPVASIKLFMGASTGDMQVDDELTLSAVFAHARLPVLTHCEQDGVIARGLARAREEYGVDIPFRAHSWIRGRSGCVGSTELAVSLAQAHNARLHVLHLSTREEAVLFEGLQGGEWADRITAETCSQYLLMDEGMYDLYGGLLKCNPSVKGRDDSDALWGALGSGAIRTLGTDHAPHLLREKRVGYDACPSGLSTIQHHLCVLLDECVRRGVSVCRMVEALCHAPASLFGVVDRGYLRVGYWADVVRVRRLSSLSVLRDAPLASKCGWSLYGGMATGHRVEMTLVNGSVSYAGGEWYGPPRGMALRYAHELGGPNS